MLFYGAEFRGTSFGHLCLLGLKEWFHPVYSGLLLSDSPYDYPTNGDIADSMPAVAYCPGNEDGTFYSPEFIPCPGIVLFADVKDIDLDGLPDIVSLDGTMNALQVRLGGENLEIPHYSLSGHPANWAVAVIDFDLDGYLDIVMGEYNKVIVMRGRGDGTFRSVPAVTADHPLRGDA